LIAEIRHNFAFGDSGHFSGGSTSDDYLCVFRKGLVANTCFTLFGGVFCL
jgi:hypothetical protein